MRITWRVRLDNGDPALYIYHDGEAVEGFMPDWHAADGKVGAWPDVFSILMHYETHAYSEEENR